MSVGRTEAILAWKSTNLSNKIIKPPTAANNSFSPKLKWLKYRTRVGI